MEVNPKGWVPEFQCNWPDTALHWNYTKKVYSFPKNITNKSITMAKELCSGQSMCLNIFLWSSIAKLPWFIKFSPIIFINDIITFLPHVQVWPVHKHLLTPVPGDPASYSGLREWTSECILTHTCTYMFIVTYKINFKTSGRNICKSYCLIK